jgi:hypothetical protein
LVEEGQMEGGKEAVVYQEGGNSSSDGELRSERMVGGAGGKAEEALTPKSQKPQIQPQRRRRKAKKREE